MKKRVFKILLAILLAGIVTMGGFYYFLQQKEPIVIIRANEEIDAETIIKEEMLYEKSIYKGDYLESYITDMEDVVGKYCKYTIPKDANLMYDSLTESLDPTIDIKANMQDDEVIAPVEIDIVSGVAGEVEAGDYVNITAIDRLESGEAYRSLLFLQHVLVYSVRNQQAESLTAKAEITTVYNQNIEYADKKPAVICLIVDVEQQALINTYDEITLSICSDDYEMIDEPDYVYNKFYEDEEDDGNSEDE